MTELSADVKPGCSSCVDKVLFSLSGVLTVFLVAWALWLMPFGLDFTDESYYIVSIASPFHYPATLTQFGFFYHPVYWLVGGDLSLLRQFNVLFTFLLTGFLGYQFLSVQFAAQQLPRCQRTIIAAALGCGGLVFLRLWLPTPSYNWLAFQALLVVAAGLVMSRAATERRCFAGWVLLGVGGWMAFLAKPSTAAALAVVVGIYLLLVWKIRWRGVCLAVVTAVVLLVVTAFLIDGSITGFVMRVQAGMELTSMMGSHAFSALFKIDAYGFDVKTTRVLRMGVALVVGTAFLLTSERRLFVAAGMGLLAICFIFTGLFALAYIPWPLGQYGFFQLLLWIGAYSALILAVLKSGIKGVTRLSRADWALAALLTVFPYLFAFGTSNNYWWMGGLTAIFWVFAGSIFLKAVLPMKGFARLLLPITAAVQLVTVGVIMNGMLFPYYQTQLVYKNDYRMVIGAEETPVILGHAIGEYLTEVRSKAKAAGFTTGTPVIDLTGHFPGVIHAIGGVNTSEAWIIGSYPGYTGSTAVAENMLQRVSCEEAAAAWLLVEPKGPFPVASETLHVIGADRTKHYLPVATFKTVPGLGGIADVQVQQLLKPTRSLHIAMAACEKAKAARQ